MLKKTLPLRRHFAVFTVMSLFALAQLGWWVYFQVREGERVTHIQRQLWEQEIQISRQQRTGYAASSPQFTQWLEQSFPDLEIASSGELSIKESARQRLDDIAGQRIRMFIAEGVFFSLLLLAGVLYMYRTLQTEIAVEQRQSVFISATSHELKTPITSLQLYVDTLFERKLSAEQLQDVLATMRQDVSRLDDLIESLLHAQALMKERESKPLQPTDLSDETRIAIEEMKSRFNPDKHPLNVDLDFGLTALADPQRWQLIVKNLLDNAHKYSPDGGVIDVFLTRTDDTARLTVTDQGLGFPESEAERIFERFYRIGSEDTRKTQGTGLGLFLVREISRSFHGRAFASTAGPGKGATFTVEVPLLKRSAHA
jgi:signal transduction histidine kinase